MRNILVSLFKVCLVLFLIGGTCLVTGQLAGVLFQNGDLIVKTWDVFANPTFMISALAGIFGFVLGYFPKDKVESKDTYSLDELSEELEHVR